MLFFLVTFLIFIPFYQLSNQIQSNNLSLKIIQAAILTTVQIVFSQFILGLLGHLTFPLILLLNFTISFLIILYAKKLSKFKLKEKSSIVFKQKLAEILTPENKLLLGLSGFVLIWLTLAAYFLPPRGGSDDIRYHLTPIYEYIVQQKIFLLPLEIQPYFAFPQNAELLFMWPAILLHSTQWVDFIQVIFAILGVLGIYQLCREFGQNRQIAVFASLLFLLAPIVILQMGTNYTDIIINVFLLIALLFGFRYFQYGEISNLLFLGISLGLLLGMKYTMLLYVLTLQIFILPRIKKEKLSSIFLYFALIGLLGSFWYIRNWYILGNPFYPAHTATSDFGIFLNFKDHAYWDEMKNILTKIKLLILQDIQFGTFDGGYGAVFWGIGFPCWIYIFLKNVFQKNVQKAKCLVLAHLILGLTVVMMVQTKGFQWTARYSLFIIAIGFIALGEFLHSEKPPEIVTKFIKTFSIIVSLMCITLMSITTYPNNGLMEVIVDKKNNQRRSEFGYYKNNMWLVPRINFFTAEPLDFMTKDGVEGFSCYISADWASFWVTNLYGSKLQNRIWNFIEHPQKGPDIFIFQNVDAQNQMYLGKKITISDITLSEENLLIQQSPVSNLFISRASLLKEKRLAYLLEYYQSAFPQYIQLSKSLKPKFTKNIPIFVLDNIGYSIQYLKLTNTIENSVNWIPPQSLSDFLLKNKPESFYSINFTIPGYETKEIYSRDTTTSKIAIYENHLIH